MHIMGDLSRISTPLKPPRSPMASSNMATESACESPTKVAADIPTPPPDVPPALTKKVWLRYESHLLAGTLHLLTTDEYLDFHSRFFDILPSSPPKVEQEACEPWVLLHSILGKTWVNAAQLPQDSPDRSASEAPGVPLLIALTDNAYLWRAADAIGHCDPDGKLIPATVSIEDPNDLIIALPCHRAFPSTRTLTPRLLANRTKSRTVGVTDYPPLPVAPDLLAMIRKIDLASTNSATSTAGAPKKPWIKENLKEWLDEKNGTLRPHSPLWPHRGNEAVFRRHVWLQLCYMSVGHGAKKLPAPYYQALFEDLQARGRIEGTERLECVDGKWYEYGGGEDLEIVEGGVEVVDGEADESVKVKHERETVVFSDEAWVKSLS